MTLNSFMHKIGGDLIFIDVKRLDHDFFYVLLDCNSRFCYSKNITFLPINMVERGTAMYLPYLGNSPYKSGMRIRILIRIRSDPLIFDPPDPDPVLFSTDPDPTFKNGFIELFLS